MRNVCGPTWSLRMRRSQSSLVSSEICPAMLESVADPGGVRYEKSPRLADLAFRALYQTGDVAAVHDPGEERERREKCRLGPHAEAPQRHRGQRARDQCGK